MLSFVRIFPNMDKPSYKLVGSPCGHHGQYTFYKAIRLTGATDRIVAIGDFFFVRIWQDSELVSIGELQLLWTDRVSDQTLVSLRLYFLPENTPDGRNQHGEDEVLAINDKVVLRAEDLLTWICDGAEWRYGLRAVWRGACAPPAEPRPSAPLHHTRLDFSDVNKEKNAIVDAESPGVVVFSYPRYCRYRALLARLEGIQAAWLRDSLVAALGGYSAPTHNTRILYCKDTFEYPELEGHEFVCNHLAPRLKGRPRGRRRRPPRSRSHTPSSRSSDSDREQQEAKTPRRLSLRNGVSDKQSSEEEESRSKSEEHTFLKKLAAITGDTSAAYVKDLSLRSLYTAVQSYGGYLAVGHKKLWRTLYPERPERARNLYARHLLPYENHERNAKRNQKINGRIDEPKPIDTIDVPDSPPQPPRIPSPKPEEFNTTSKPAEELNREFLESLPKEEKPAKITVKPVEKLLEPVNKDITKLFEENSSLVQELASKYKVEESRKVIEEISSKQISEGSSQFLSELAQRLNLGPSETTFLKETPPVPESGATNLSTVNGHAPNGNGEQKSRPAGRSSLRAVRVKPTRTPLTHPSSTPPNPPLRPDSASSSPPLPVATNFGIHRAPAQPDARHSDDEIVEVPYKPKTPEIIDLDEYPESPQAFKKKKLDILKERGLEVTAIPPTWGVPPPVPLPPLINPPIMLNPAMQHQIMTQASLFQMYNIIPQNYANGIQPPKVIQATCIYGSTGPEKTVYGNPKDPFMPPPHVLHGAPVKPNRVVTTQQELRPQDVLDLTCKTTTAPSQKPAVEIVKIPSAPSPSKTAQNLSKSYTLVDGKAVVGSNLEITLVNPKSQTPQKNRAPQKRSSNGKFMSTKTPTPPKDYPKAYSSPSPSGAKTTSPGAKKTPLVVPNYPLRDDASPTSSTGSRDSQSNLGQTNMLPSVYKGQNLLMDLQKGQSFGQFSDLQKGQSLMDLQKSQNITQLMDLQKSQSVLDLQKGQNLSQIMDLQKSQNLSRLMDLQKNQNISQLMDLQKNQSILDLQNGQNLSQIMDLQKSQNLSQIMDLQKSQNLSQIMDLQKSVPMSPFIDPMYMSALYNSLAGSMDQRQLAMYRDFMATQFRGYSGLLGGVATPTTKN